MSLCSPGPPWSLGKGSAFLAGQHHALGLCVVSTPRVLQLVCPSGGYVLFTHFQMCCFMMGWQWGPQSPQPQGCPGWATR